MTDLWSLTTDLQEPAVADDFESAVLGVASAPGGGGVFLFVIKANERILGMLVLSRKKDERILIGDEIAVEVVEIRVKAVRLGITAPREVTIHREEVYRAIQAQGEANNGKS